MAVVYIAIGSNLGRRKQNCVKAVSLLGEAGVRVTAESSMHETEPWGLEDQPKFINMAVEARTDLEPRQLLSALKSIEHKIGRTETVRFGPRVIDLDLIFYGQLVISEPGLEVPHPAMHGRDFVLRPLAEIAPDVVHPVLGRSVRQLLEGLERQTGQADGLS